MTLTIHKIQNKVRLPLSETAVKLLGKPLKEGVVFNGLTEHALNKYIPMLIKTAGINKHITFHLASHSISSFTLRTSDLQN